MKLSECPGYVSKWIKVEVLKKVYLWFKILSACPHDNESYKKSFYYCGETCQNATRIDCGENKFKNGCVCDNGFLRDEVAGGCISEEKCKNGTQDKQAK